jgi:hypothetical protein
MTPFSAVNSVGAASSNHGEQKASNHMFAPKHMVPRTAAPKPRSPNVPPARACLM